MFDVDWSDPHRESVGDRRARKVKEKDKTADADDHYQKADDQDTDRNSGSITFSESSSERQFRFFGSKHRKKSSSASRKSKAKSLTGSSLRSPTIDEQPQAESRSLESTINLQTDGTSGNEPSYLASRRFSGKPAKEVDLSNPDSNGRRLHRRRPRALNPTSQSQHITHDELGLTCSQDLRIQFLRKPTITTMLPVALCLAVI